MQRYTKEFVDAGDYFTITFFDGYKKELGVLGLGEYGDKITEVNFDKEEEKINLLLNKEKWFLSVRKSIVIGSNQNILFMTL